MGQHEERSPLQIPAPCPACGGTGGMPFMSGTTIEPSVIRVGLRCSKCHHEWHLELPQRQPAAAANPPRSINPRS
jgi:hypothetical protein